MVKLGERLRTMRKAHQLTLKALSERAALSVPYLSGVERGVVNPSIETLQKIAQAYGIKVADLLTGVEEAGESTRTVYPKGFLEFAADPDYRDELDEDWKEALLRIEFRGRRPTTKREWIELYLFLRRILASKEDAND